MASRLITLVLTCAACGTSISLQAAGQPNDASLPELSLEELTNLQVSTVSRRAEKATDVAAAVFVITQDDIRRSGARSIPETLRLVPGLEVAQIDSNKWAISARGFNGRFANKLLVMMDGRTLYTSSFSGTYWDTQDTVIEDIARIEVIRGPAGTVWGTNAVNGIINIITKDSRQTDGLLVAAERSDHAATAASIRYGSGDYGDLAWRTYGRYAADGANELFTGAKAYDDFEQFRVGARADLRLSSTDEVSATFEAYRGHSGETLTSSVLVPISPLSPAIGYDAQLDGAWGLFNWTHSGDSGARTQFKTYFDHSDRSDPIAGERRDTLDLDLQQVLPRVGRHLPTWGAGVRFTRDHFAFRELYLLTPASDDFWLASAYAQDEIAFLEGRLALTAGARIEAADQQSTAVLPNIRARFATTSNSSLWAGVSRGERRPSRAERSVIAVGGSAIPPGIASNPFPVPMVVGVQGWKNFGSERLTAYELGWRWWNGDRWSVDVATYYDRYDRLRGMGNSNAVCEPSGISVYADPSCLFTASHVFAYTTLANAVRGDLRGAEVGLRWSPTRQWRLIGTYTHIERRLRGRVAPETGLFVIGADPENQYGLRSTVSFGPRWDWDLSARRVDAVSDAGIPSYTELGTRLAFRPTLNTEIALVGSNLLHSKHLEGVSELVDLMPTAIERSVALQMRWYVE
jgi:iron complex outermembrane receptor protein